MSEDLISKKELLDLTGISYGQLYRWKRKNLIPEQWFIRKSSFTGQETFFPRDKIIRRIDKILNMKDDLSLDALADVFSPNLADVQLTAGEIMERNIVTSAALNLYIETVDPEAQHIIFEFDKLLSIYVLDRWLQSGDIALDEGRLLIQALNEHLPRMAGMECGIILIRKMGVSAFLLIPNDQEIYMDPGVKMVAHLSLAQCTEELKLLVNGSEG
ncbi:YhbD family protein [Paenibacillus motobuensis]|uniref:YhbD family protein n=1 Tax=Paenibacillus TaxID=44249 RepID=UPI00203BEB7C|nr:MULTISPECIES: YhbD family protein [Paenibacillus]MCM3040902.1 YhbD family protein [Paenibacillus lutimineralis]MCM3648006.1 YhbD family protein [Paenibacillus motobuensis]